MPSSASRWSLVFGLLLALSPRAAAAADGEAVLALEPGLSILTQPAPEEARHDFVGTASAWLGISDAVWAAVSFGIAAPGQDHQAVEALGGLVLALDVLRIIPFLEAMAGVLSARDTTFAAVRLGAGFDYLFTEHVSIGLVGRYRPLQDELGDNLLSIEGRLALRLEL